MIQLRPYQQALIDGGRNAYRQGCRSVLFNLPTGGGKTVTASTIVHGAAQKQNVVWWLCHRRELVAQASQTFHALGIPRSKRKVVGDIAKDIERVYGKERLLVEIASASINEPSGRICDVIFPIAGKAKLAAIVKESHAKGALDRRIYKVMRGSWANHYRRMLPSLLSVLEFRSNNAVWRPVLAALDWIRSKVDGGCRFVPLQDVPIDEVIPARWRSSVIDDDGRVNRISYEG